MWVIGLLFVTYVRSTHIHKQNKTKIINILYYKCGSLDCFLLYMFVRRYFKIYKSWRKHIKKLCYECGSLDCFLLCMLVWRISAFPKIWKSWKISYKLSCKWGLMDSFLLHMFVIWMSVFSLYVTWIVERWGGTWGEIFFRFEGILKIICHKNSNHKYFFLRNKNVDIFDSTKKIDIFDISDILRFSRKLHFFVFKDLL